MSSQGYSAVGGKPELEEGLGYLANICKEKIGILFDDHKENM